MITHYDIKVEAQRLKQVLSDEGVNIPPLFQVIKPGLYVFMWVLLWPAFLRFLLYEENTRDIGFDICFSGVMGFILFVAITNGLMLYLAIPDSFRNGSKVVAFMYSKGRGYILSFLIIFSLISFTHSFLYAFLLIITCILFSFVYAIDINRYNLSAIVSVIGLFKKESVG
ncbi:conjugal transfer entry exclusion protein TraS [Salmonella enterica]